MQIIYKALARAIAKRPRLVDWIVNRAKRTPYITIMSRDGKHEYMRRYWLFNAYQLADGTWPKRNPIMRLLPSIRIHEILRKDEDKHLHDHPFNAQSLILRGWYLEQTENPEFESAISPNPSNPEFRNVIKEAGDSYPIRFGQYHRIVGKSFEPVITLFITFGYKGTWGFKVGGRKVKYMDYFSGNYQVGEIACASCAAPVPVMKCNEDLLDRQCALCASQREVNAVFENIKSEARNLK